MLSVLSVRPFCGQNVLEGELSWMGIFMKEIPCGSLPIKSRKRGLTIVEIEERQEVKLTSHQNL